jgi:hypothetical protein
MTSTLQFITGIAEKVPEEDYPGAVCNPEVA